MLLLLLGLRLILGLVVEAAAEAIILVDCHADGPIVLEIHWLTVHGADKFIDALVVSEKHRFLAP